MFVVTELAISRTQCSYWPQGKVMFSKVSVCSQESAFCLVSCSLQGFCLQGGRLLVVTTEAGDTLPTWMNSCYCCYRRQDEGDIRLRADEAVVRDAEERCVEVLRLLQERDGVWPEPRHLQVSQINHPKYVKSTILNTDLNFDLHRNPVVVFPPGGATITLSWLNVTWWGGGGLEKGKLEATFKKKVFISGWCGETMEQSRYFTLTKMLEPYNTESFLKQPPHSLNPHESRDLWD